MVTLTGDEHGWTVSGTVTKPDEGLSAIWRTIVLGVRDYVQKNGFDRVLLGLSGGIDSAIVAAIAVDALGADKVEAVMMPSPYTSQNSLDDAADQAKRLGIQLDTISIALLWLRWKLNWRIVLPVVMRGLPKKICNRGYAALP